MRQRADQSHHRTRYASLSLEACIIARDDDRLYKEGERF